MMHALSNPQAQQLREQAMSYFGEGFAGLRVAFDTTFVALIWVVVVGLLLERLRRRAFHLLSGLGQSIDQQIRTEGRISSIREILLQLREALFQPPQDERQPSSGWLALLYERISEGLGEVQDSRWMAYLTCLSQIAKLLQEGLFRQTQPGGSPVPLLQSVEATVQEGLLAQGGGTRVPLLQLGLLQEGKGERLVSQLSQAIMSLQQLHHDVISCLEEFLKVVRNKSVPDLQRIHDLLEEILREGLKRTYVQWRHLKPEVHEILERLRARRGHPRPPSTSELDKVWLESINENLLDGLYVERLSIKVVGVANRASRICVAGETQQIYFVRDQSIHWIDRVFQVRPGIAWTGSLRLPDFTPPTRIESLTYSPAANTLFVLSTDGTVTALKQDGLCEYPPNALRLFEGSSLLWFPSRLGLPRVVCWIPSGGGARFGISLLGGGPALGVRPAVA